MVEMVIKWEVGNGVDMGEEVASLEQYSMDLKFRPYNLHQQRREIQTKQRITLGKANKQSNP